MPDISSNSSQRIVYRLLLLCLSILLIPAVPIFLIFGGAATPEYVIFGTLDMHIADRQTPFGMYIESLGNLLTFHLGTSTATGQSVMQTVALSFGESAKAIIPALILSLLVGVTIFLHKPKGVGKSVPLSWICFVPMVVFSYVLIFVVDKVGLDVTSEARYMIAIVVLSIYPTYVVYNSLVRCYKGITESEFYEHHRAFGFTPVAIRRLFLPKYFLIEMLSLFEGIFIYMFGFVYFVESPLAINGAGSQFVWSIRRYDYPMIIGYCLMTIIMLTVINLIVDMLILKLGRK